MNSSSADLKEPWPNFREILIVLLLIVLLLIVLLIVLLLHVVFVHHFHQLLRQLNLQMKRSFISLSLRPSINTHWSLFLSILVHNKSAINEPGQSLAGPEEVQGHPVAGPPQKGPPQQAPAVQLSEEAWQGQATGAPAHKSGIIFAIYIEICQIFGMRKIQTNTSKGHLELLHAKDSPHLAQECRLLHPQDAQQADKGLLPLPQFRKIVGVEGNLDPPIGRPSGNHCAHLNKDVLENLTFDQIDNRHGLANNIKS